MFAFSARIVSFCQYVSEGFFSCYPSVPCNGYLNTLVHLKVCNLYQDTK